MGWDKGRYYTRSKKVNGRVVRQYVGTGRAAELAAQVDALVRQQRHDERLAFLAEKADIDDLDADLAILAERTDLLTRAALLAAGFRQHKRGEWRKRRAKPHCSEQGHSDRPGGDQQTDTPCPAR
jgi:hypothetical protein